MNYTVIENIDTNYDYDYIPIKLNTILIICLVCMIVLLIVEVM
jgi:hypothetical protein